MAAISINVRYIEEAFVARLESRAALFAAGMLADADSIGPRGTGNELFPSVDFVASAGSQGHGLYEVLLTLFINTSDGNGISGYDQSRNISAELEAALHNDPQIPTSAQLLEINGTGYNYKVLGQEREYASGPVPIAGGGDAPAIFEAVDRYRLTVANCS